MELILSVVRGKPGVVGAFVGPGSIHIKYMYIVQIN